MSVYIKIQQNLEKMYWNLREIVRDPNKDIRYMITIQKSITFIYSSKKTCNLKQRKVQCTIGTKMTYLSIHIKLYIQDLYTDNYQ